MIGNPGARKLLSGLGLDPSLKELTKVRQAFESLARSDRWFFAQNTENCRLHWAERS